MIGGFREVVDDLAEVTRESRKVPGDLSQVIDDLAEVTDESGEVIDGFRGVIDDLPQVAGESPEVVADGGGLLPQPNCFWKGFPGIKGESNGPAPRAVCRSAPDECAPQGGRANAVFREDTLGIGGTDLRRVGLAEKSEESLGKISTRTAFGKGPGEASRAPTKGGASQKPAAPRRRFQGATTTPVPADRQKERKAL